MNKEGEYKDWLDNTFIPNVLKDVSKETLISLYLPILLANSLIEKENLLRLLFISEIKIFCAHLL